MEEPKALSFEQRGKVYARVFADMVKASQRRSYGSGFCSFIPSAVRSLGLASQTEEFDKIQDNLRDLRKFWPEMAEIKPKTQYREPGCTGSSGYWWADSRAGRITRLKKLQGILKEHYGINVPIPEGI